MNYIQVDILSTEPDQRDLLVALLAEQSFEGFEERDDRLLAFIAEEEFNEEELSVLLGEHGVSFETSRLAKVNWNKQWEENFQPVIVDGFCTVRADFHQLEVDTPYEVVITPKMSFGTGHHATTQLMMRMMQSIAFQNRTVLDFGTGTGILAILAEKLGAAQVDAIDNDDWSYENAVENGQKNNVSCIRFALGSLESVANLQFDIILANINRHILLHYMNDLYACTQPAGTVLMSGLLAEDKEIIVASASNNGFLLESHEQEGNWIALRFSKQ
jgi:ribosomal protein L11 methyltransferase